MDYTKYLTNHNRFSNYIVGRQLYLGQHSEVFKINQFEYFTNPKVDYLTYNYPEILTNNFSNLIWSEEPDIDLESDKNQEYVSDWIKSEQFLTTLRECSETASYAGDAVVRLRTENGKVYLEQIDNSIWYPIFDPNNPTKKAVGHILKFSKTIENGNNKRKYCLLEIHKAGSIEWEAYEIVNNEYKRLSDPLSVFGDELSNVLINKAGEYRLETGCEMPLVFHLKNNSISNEFFGLSDYTQSVIAKIYAINSNLNQIQYVLKRHAHPKMVVPKSIIKAASYEVLNDNTKASQLNFGSKEAAQQAFQNGGKDWFSTKVAERIINNAEFLGSDDMGGKPEYLTWNGNLQESHEMIKLLKDSLMQESQLSKVLVDPDMAIGSSSGVAILRMAQPSLHKAEKKQSYLKDFIRSIIYSLQELTILFTTQKLDDAEYPDIQFRDGLVNDLKEIIENQTAMLDAGIQSKVGAIAEVKNIDDEKALIEYQEIQDENNIFGGDSSVIVDANV